VQQNVSFLQDYTEMHGQQNTTNIKNPSVYFQEDLHMQFYGISFMHPYKQSGRWQDVHIKTLIKKCDFLVLVT